MRFILLIAVCVAGALGSSVRFTSVPSSVTLPRTSEVAGIRLSALPQLNSYILGLSAKAVNGFSVETDLFSRPRALAVIRVDGFDAAVSNGDAYNIETGGIPTTDLDEQLALVFGGDRETAETSARGVVGSGIAHDAQQQQLSEIVIKTKDDVLRAELESIYKLAAAIEKNGAKFAQGGHPDVYRVNVAALGGKQMDDEERQVAIEDVQNAIEKLTTVLNNVYAGQALVEVISISNIIDSMGSPMEPHSIKKRDAAPVTDADKRLKTARDGFNVYSFTSTDYPAIFAIFLGLIIALVLAVLYATVGMMTMDPGKDSIIYRMTTTRMKKD